MIDDEKHILLVEEIKRLYIDYEKAQENQYKEKEKRFSKLCEELHGLYEIEKERVFKGYVRPFINEYPFIEEISSLRVIDKLSHETYHSLFLRHIWNSQNSFGYEVLKEFLSTVVGNEEWLDTLHLRTYEVKKEVQTKELKDGNDKKRIDLLIVDENNKWCIAIENKIVSKIRYNKKDNRSQLDPYYKFCEKKYKGFERLYILLSHNEKNAFHRKAKWKYANYYDIFKSLLKHHTKDSLIRDYLKTLFKLLFPNETMDEYKESSIYRGMQFYNNIIIKIK